MVDMRSRSAGPSAVFERGQRGRIKEWDNMDRVLAFQVPAPLLAAETAELDIVVKLLGGGGAVLEDGQPLAVVDTNTKVDRGPVADGLRAVTPLAALLGGNTLGVNVVLSRGNLALPLVVGLAVRASQGLERVVAKVKRDGLGLGTYQL